MKGDWYVVFFDYDELIVCNLNYFNIYFFCGLIYVYLNNWGVVIVDLMEVI